MERYDRNRIHSERMEFVDLIADKVNTIKHDYGLSEQTAIEILKMRQLSDDLDSIRNVLQDIHNTI